MPTMDSTARAALENVIVTPAFFIFLDILGDPIRVTTYGADVTVSGSGDSELDGTYTAASTKVLRVGEVTQSDNGSDTLTIELSAILGIDTALMNEIGDKTKWQGRPVRLWFRLYDEAGTAAQGGYVPYYTGYASSVEVSLAPGSQAFRLKVENYLSAFNEASHRSYLNQKDYDAADVSAAASIAASNGASRHGSGGAPGSAIARALSARMFGGIPVRLVHR